MKTTTIAIIDDQNIFRQVLGMAISTVPGFKLVGTFENGLQFIDALAHQNLTPDVAILDIDMPGMNGIELNETLQASYPKVKTIMLSQHTEERLIASLIRAGAAAYLDKSCKQEELITAVKSVAATGFYINNQVLSSLKGINSQQQQKSNLTENLSTRELAVLKMLCMQYTNMEIADQLFISVKTVDFHRANLLKKTNSRNVAGLVIYALKNNLIQI